MADPTAEQLARRARELQLVEDLDVQDILREVGRPDASADEFRRIVLRRDLMTNYQLDRLLSGETTGYFYGDYKVLYFVGSGTFARVYRATDRYSGQVVAVKVLRKRFRNEPEQLEQFVREGEMGTSLRHDNIVGLYEVHGRAPQPYLVMEFVEGRNLREFMRVRKYLEPHQAVRLAAGVCRGLAFAFDRGITHRDLKLSNILISSKGEAKLVDFGLAAAGGEVVSDEALADCPNPRTIDYAGLERASGVRRNDPRSDIFFLGSILYHMLSGQAALFETKDRLQRLAVSRYEDIIPIVRLMPDLPLDVIHAVNKSLEFRPDQRYQSPSEMLADLEAILNRIERGGKKSDQQATEPQAQPSIEEPTERGEGYGHTVMIVEPSVGMQNVLRKKLKQLDYKVLVYSDPDRAINRFRETDEDAPPPADCVVFCADKLGYDALHAFNTFGEPELTKGIPAMLLLDESQQQLTTQANTSDHRVVLSMPLRFGEFRQQIQRLVGLQVGQS